MSTANSELISQLRTAIAGWTAEVGVAQDSLSRQIDGANAQLKRLLEVLRERNGHAVALAQANAELAELRRSVQGSGLPAGAVTQYSAAPGNAGNAATKELAHTYDRLENAVHSWTEQVGRSQGGLIEQFNTTNGQLERLVVLLGNDANGSVGAAPEQEAELEQLQHENSVLNSEVYALNIELESLRREQEDFASANLASETERIVRQRAELEQLEDLLRARDEELAAGRRSEGELAREFESLQKELARRDVSEQHLREAVDLQRRETGQHLEALSALTREMGALRRAFLGGEAPESDTERPDVVAPGLGEEDPAEYRLAIERISSLEATIGQLELEREEVGVLKERISGFQAQIAELEARPEAVELEAAQGRIVELENTIDRLSSEGIASAAAADALREEMDALRAQAETLEARPTREELDASEQQVAELREALGQLAADRDRVDAEVAEAAALRGEIGLLKAQFEALEAREELPDVAELESTIADLRDQLAEARAVSLETTRAGDAEKEGLRLALANVESELKALQRREEDTVASARTLLEELESHRKYEAAQDMALSEARAGAARLEDEAGQVNTRLAEKARALETALEIQTSLEARLASLEAANAGELAALRGELEAAGGRERALAEKVAAYEVDLAAGTEHEAEIDGALARANAELAAQQQALADRDAQIEVLRQDIAELDAQRRELAGREADSRQQTEALGEALSAMRETDTHYQEELGKNRALLEELRAEHGRQQDTVQDLSSRGRELEVLLDAARADEMTSLATVEELQAALKAVQDKEQAEAAALAEAQGLLATQQAALVHWETEVSALETRMAAMAAEKDQLSEETAQQQEEIRLAMAEVSRAMHERDELLEALEAEKTKKGRVHAGAAGDGLGAADALEAREMRARQQDILVSELTHTDHNRGLGNILVDAGILTSGQLESALEAQEQDPSQLLGTILIERGYATDDAIAQAVACQLQKPMVNPMEIHIHKDAAGLLNKDICTWHVCVPLRMTGDRMVVAMANPLDESAIMKLRDVSQREITPVVGTPTQIMGAIENCYGSF